MANQQVRVFVRTVNGVKEARVWPPTMFAAASDTVEFINNTGDEMFVNFADIFTGAGNHKKQVTPGTPHKPTVKAGGLPTRGSRFEYQIFCAETNSIAIGNSAPEVIIE